MFWLSINQKIGMDRKATTLIPWKTQCALVQNSTKSHTENMPSHETLPRLVRVSLGTALVLGLAQGKLDARPSTAYFMTYSGSRCTANCRFCSQARDSSSRGDMLSRVTWPTFSTADALEKLRHVSKTSTIKRACIQALNYSQVFDDVASLVEAVKKESSLAVSVSCQPLNANDISLMKRRGADRLGLPLDAATREVFDNIKGKTAGGPYVWDKQLDMLRKAVAIFGKNNVSTHLIVGLGETEEEIIAMIQKCVVMGVLPGLFAFTPVKGTSLEDMRQPPIKSYRRIQMARFLILEGADKEKMSFNLKGELVDFGVKNRVLHDAADSGAPFLTSGCPSCNRPYYNEKPSGPIYNFPRKPSAQEILLIKKNLDLSGA